MKRTCEIHGRTCDGDRRDGRTCPEAPESRCEAARVSFGLVDGERVHFRAPNPAPDDLEQDLLEEGDR